MILSRLLIVLVISAAVASADDKESDTTLPGPNDWVNTYPDAELVHNQAPVYPELSKKAGHQGLVKVKALIDGKGRVRNAIIYQSSNYPLLDQAALDAAPLCKWKPGCTSGWPVASWATYDVEFKLEQSKTGASSTKPKSFAVLVHRETGFNKESKLPEGKLWLWAGFTKGLDSGTTGVIQRKNDVTGWVPVADVTVEWVNGYESRCRFVLKNKDFALRDWDRAYFEVEQSPNSAILERGLAAYSSGRLHDALTYLDEVWCLARTNDFVAQITEQCRERIKNLTATEVASDQLLAWRRSKNDMLCIAQIFIKAEEFHAAERLVDEVLLVDSANSIALSFRDSIPEADYYTASIAECNRFDSLLAGTVMPRVDEFVPYDSLARFVSGDDPVYPFNDKRLMGMVVVEILADKNGAAADATVTTSSGYDLLDEAALRCARTRKYRPAFIQSTPVASWVQLEVWFSP